MASATIGKTTATCRPSCSRRTSSTASNPRAGNCSLAGKSASRLCPRAGRHPFQDFAMTDIARAAIAHEPAGLSANRSLLIAVIGFLTLVDLFATQAILPSLAQSYGVTPAQIGLAANASTLGMAISGLLVGVFSANIERKRAIALSLLVLSLPTAMLAFAPNLTVFAILRVLQGLFMAAAFTLTL